MSNYEDLRKKCLSLIETGHFDTAIKVAHEMLDLIENNQLNISIENVFEGREKVLRNTPNSILYVTYMQRLIKILEKKKNFEKMIKMMYYLGIEFVSTNNFTDAEIIFSKAMKIAKQINSFSSQADLLNGYGNISEQKNEDEKALEYYMLAFNMAKEYNYDEGKRFAHNIGFGYKKLGKYSKAIHYLNECIDYLKTTDMTARMANAYNELGDTYRRNGNYKLAHEALDQGLKLSELTKSNSFIMENYQFRSSVYEMEENYNQALKSYKQFHEMSTLLNIERFNNEIKTLTLERELNAQAQKSKIIKEKNEALEAYSKALKDSNLSLMESLEETKRLTQHAMQSEKNANYSRMIMSVAHHINTSISNVFLLSEQMESELSEIINKVENSTLKRSDLECCISNSVNAMDLINKSSKKIIQFIDMIKNDSIAVSDLKASGTIANLLQECSDNYAVQLEDQQCKLSIFVMDNMPRIYAFNIFKVVINQLFDNSLKYAFTGRENNEITIKVWINDRGKLSITFKDNGIGIPKDKLTRIFDPFYTTNMGISGGLGMGLFILKKTVEEVIGGSVHCESSVEEGTSMIIEVDNVNNSIF